MTRSAVQRGGKKPAKASGRTAAFDGRCSGCAQPIKRGSPIGRFGTDWLHAACVDAKTSAAKVLAGETFRSQRRSDWRLGGSPSSPRVR